LSVHITNLFEEKQAFLTLFCQIRLLKDRFQQVWLRLQAKNKDIKRIFRNAQKNRQSLREFI